MVRRHELTDAECAMPEPLLKQRLGRPRADDRRVPNGIVFKFRSGAAWRDVPERYGSWRSLHTRFRWWAADGTFTRMLQAAHARADAAGDLDWLAAVSSTIVRATPPAPEKRAPGARPLAGRADEQDPSGLRRQRTPTGIGG
ncbi:transposase [Actinomadura sp. NBRC 104425]|uniref:transposase n=1 Tax=Actinomadura sp. NBRC 104425 TaxID=3032204 RepID=UPI0024A4139B|nr:transposase [Actinomadura sp. NBRC 104425]GLZ12683.1 transposase [Actinomadura sp. NBRC 104425]